MTLRSLERLLTAQEAVATAETPDARRKAEHEYVAAEREHLTRLGVDLGEPTKLMLFMPVALVILLVVTLGLVVKLSYDQSTTTADNQTYLTKQLREACEKAGNPRVRQSNLRVPIEKAELKGLVALGVMLSQAKPGDIKKADPLVLDAFNNLPSVDQVKTWLEHVKVLPEANCNALYRLPN